MLEKFYKFNIKKLFKNIMNIGNYYYLIIDYCFTSIHSIYF